MNAYLYWRLKINNQNSYKPPRIYGDQKKLVGAVLSRKEKPEPGGKKDHKGKTLRQVERPDQIHVDLPVSCMVSGQTISAEAWQSIAGKRQGIDLLELKLVVREHLLRRFECCGCTWSI